MAAPMSVAAMGTVMREVMRRNRVRDGLIYVQVTRGVAPRQHAFPTTTSAPSLVVTARTRDRRVGESIAAGGVAVISVPDTRWYRVDIKSIGLLANVLAKQEAVEAGAAEALFVDEEGFITEGASANVWIITAGVLVTHPADHRILRGIARTVVFDLAARKGLTIDERRFTLAELRSADEAFLTSATQQLTPVVRIDGGPIGPGTPGPLTMRLRAAFHQCAEISPP
jgi:D-alanine transaminase